MGIHDDIKANTLTEEQLNKYLKDSGFSLDETRDGPLGLTPLCTAAKEGNLSAVKLLLKKNADPNTPTNKNNRTPLWYATIGPQERPEIVECLLKAGGKPNIRATGKQSRRCTTPLENAQNENHNTVLALLKGAPSSTAKVPKPTVTGNFLQDALSYFQTILNAVNSYAGGVLKRVFGLGATASKPKDPVTPEEFEKEINQFIDSMNLGDFFKPGDPFLKLVAHKASEYIKNENAKGPKSPEDIKYLTKLGVYQVVLFVDDSGSMSSYNLVQPLAEIAGRITDIATKFVPDGEGVEFKFINREADSTWSKIGSGDIAKDKLSQLQCRGGTPLGTRLEEKVLDPLLYPALKSRSLKRPMLISIITDGEPNSESPGKTLVEVLRRCKDTIDEYDLDSSSVLFQISQIGSAPESKNFISSLESDSTISRYIHCNKVTLDAQLNALQQAPDYELERWLLKTLVQPILNATAVKP